MPTPPNHSNHLPPLQNYSKTKNILSTCLLQEEIKILAEICRGCKTRQKKENFHALKSHNLNHICKFCYLRMNIAVYLTLFGISWLREGSYFHLLLHGRLGRGFIPFGTHELIFTKKNI